MVLISIQFECSEKFNHFKNMGNVENCDVYLECKYQGHTCFQRSILKGILLILDKVFKLQLH